MAWRTSDSLNRVLGPTSIAVIEDGPEGDFLGPRIRKNLGEGGYEGTVFRVTPGRKRRGCRLTYASLFDMDQDIDLAVIAAPPSSVPSLIRTCAQAEVAGVVVLPPLGDATSDQIRSVETRIVRQLKSSEMRIIGPNSLGILCPHAKYNASLLRPMPQAGKVAFLSQSRSLCEAILDHARRERVGFSHFVCVGSMLDVDAGDLINYFGSDPAVRSIVLHVERLTRVRKFISASRSVARVKPILALTPFRARQGAPSGISGTASGTLPAEAGVYDAVFERAGIVRVNTVQELFDCSEFLAKKPVPRTPGLAIISNAGAPAAMAVSSLAAHGIEPAHLLPETAGGLDDLLPASWNRANPIHVFREASPERYRRVVQICARAREISELLIIHVPSAYETGSAIAVSVEQALKDVPIPVVAVWMGGERAERGRRVLRRAGIPTCDTPERAAATLASLTAYVHNIEMSQEIPPKLPDALSLDKTRAGKILQEALRKGETVLTARRCKVLLEAYGIPLESNLAGGVPEDTVPFEGEKEAATTRIGETPFTRTTEPVSAGRDIELRLGVQQYAEVGPVLTFGMGGAWSKVLRDQAIGLPPLNRLLARRLMEKTQACRILENFSGTTPRTFPLFEEILIRLSQLTTDFPEIEAVEIDTVVAGPEEVRVEGGNVRVRLMDLPSPLHLAISPYPNQYEWTTRTKGGIEVFIRPIRPEDAPLLLELFASMSSQSVWFRFMGPVKGLSPEMLHQMTQIDYDRDIALVALGRSEAPGQMLGCCHLVRHPRYRWAEIAPMVGDAWQGRGVGAKLLEYCLVVARERGIESVRGLVSLQNTHMLALADRFRMTRTRVPGSAEVELRIDLSKAAV